MAIVYNSTNEQQDIKIYGNWFSFKPGQIKSIDDKLAHGICTDKKEHGIVALPVEFEDLEYRNTPEGQAALAAKREEGLSHYLGKLRSLVANNTVSLRQDLARANMQLDPSILVSSGELAAAKILAKYQQAHTDVAQKQADEFKKLVVETESRE